MEIPTKYRTLDGGDTGCSPYRDPRRLFMGNLPKAKADAEILAEVGDMTPGLIGVITYKNAGDPSVHRGFCFLDYASEAAAAAAKARLERDGTTVFGCKTLVDWADPEPEPDADLMAAVRVLFVRMYGGAVDEAALARTFGRYGRVERVKRLKGYAFVHFARRENARAAMVALDGQSVDDGGAVWLEVSWAKPPADKRVREQVLRNRERRMQTAVTKRPVGATAATACRRARTSSYLDYDHYRYDFGRRSAAECVALCPCTAAAAAADERASLPALRLDCGDHAADGAECDLDTRVVRFFGKIRCVDTE